MATAYSADDLMEFLDHAADKGLMPAVTAQALAVASRKVLGVLTDQEQKDLSSIELDSVIKRFTNKRAKDFNPASLKEYGRRVHRAIELFLRWRSDPANFTVKTRATSASRKKDKSGDVVELQTVPSTGASTVTRLGTYSTSIPVRPGVVITLANVPYDLSAADAERLAAFVRMLAVEA